MTIDDIIKHVETKMSDIENDPVYFAKMLPSEYNMYKFKNKKYNIAKEYHMRAFKKFLDRVFNKCFIMRNKYSRVGYVAFKCIEGQFFIKYPNLNYNGHKIVEKRYYPCELVMLLPPRTYNLKIIHQNDYSFRFRQAGIWFNISKKYNGEHFTELIIFDDEDSMELYLELNNI